MNNSDLLNKFIKYAVIVLVAYLYLDGSFNKVINSFNPTYKSDNPNIEYSKISYPIGRDDSGERLSSDYFDGITYGDALKLEKPILLFTYTPECPVSEHIKELIYPIGEQYKDQFTFVVLKPSIMELSVPSDDPINDLLLACRTPICTYNKQKNFVMSLKANGYSTNNDITKALDEFLSRSQKI